MNAAARSLPVAIRISDVLRQLCYWKSKANCRSWLRRRGKLRLVARDRALQYGGGLNNWRPTGGQPTGRQPPPESAVFADSVLLGQKQRTVIRDAASFKIGGVPIKSGVNNLGRRRVDPDATTASS